MTQMNGCPKCGFDDARYLNVVHESGLSSVDTRTRGTGCNPLSILLFPLIGFWSLLFSSFGTARTTGTLQSVESARAGPPARKPVAFSLLMVLAGLALLPGHTVLGLLLLAVGALSFYTAWTYNRRVHPYQYQVWEQSAMCQRCGTVFVPDASRITLDAVTTGQLLGEQRRRLVTVAQPLLKRAQDTGGQLTRKVVNRTGELRVAARREGKVNAAQVEPQTDTVEPNRED